MAFGSAEFTGFMSLRSLNGWLWLLAILGFGSRLARPARILGYLGPAVLPFYILHQTVAVIAAFYLVQADLAVPFKYLLTAALTFLGSWLLYEGLVRRIGILRLLFGMAPMPSAPPKAALKSA